MRQQHPSGQRVLSLGEPAFLFLNMKTIVYIDGLNLYYGALKDTPYRWLDLKLLSNNWLQKTPYKQCDITDIKYFTSRAIGKPSIVQNQQSQKKQRSDLYNMRAEKRYLDALEAHIEELEIIYGTHVQHTAYAYAKKTGKRVEVFTIEEKETDVHLACSLLNDAYMARYDCAAIVTSDTDMSPALALLKKHHPHKKVIILNPYVAVKSKTPQKLEKYCDFSAKIRKSVLAQSQLPPTVEDKKTGKIIKKPLLWCD